MTATQHLTPEGFRTAAYLEARKRTDARRKTKNVSCNPPNVRCGNRCIPPSWDCRIKGEGSDPHLRAVKTDPLGGLANIERGTKRLIKGVAKGSPSDIYGGKQAIIRGTVKIAPGNIEQKKQLRERLERRTYSVGIGLLVAGGGFGLHNILMKSNTFGYRNGVGRDINESVKSGVNQVLDSIPVLGDQRRRTRSAVATANTEAAYRAAFNRVAGPDTLRQTLGSGGERAIPNTPLTSTLRDSHSNLSKAVDTVNRSLESDASFYEWDRQHREAFWGATVQSRSLGKISVFAKPAAETYLARQFGIESYATKSDLKEGIIRRIEEERLNLISLAKQRGYRTLGGRSTKEYIDTKDYNAFVREVVGASGIMSTPIRQGLEDHVTSVLSSAASTYTNKLYKDTVTGFDAFYKEVGSTFVDATPVSFGRSLSGSTQNIQQQSDLLRASYLARQMNREPAIRGPRHAEVIRTAFFATRVRGSASSNYSITPNTAVSAARELTGRSDRIGPNEAYRILREQFGFTGLVPPSATSRRGASRGDSVSPEVVRASAYLATRSDLKEDRRLGKPCGKAHIPKNHKCRQQETAESKSKEVTQNGLGSSTESTNRNKPSKGKLVLGAVAAVLGTAGAVSAAAVAVDATRYFKNNHLPSTGSYREILKKQLKKNGLSTKDSQVALGKYYDEAAKDWKLGEVVYYKQGADLQGHFGIYLGKREGRHQFAGVGANAPNSDSPSNANVGLTEYGPGSGKYDSKPVIWAKAPEHVQPPRMYSDTEIARRATLLLGKPYKLDMLENNCEAWSTMIVAGVPYSTQSRRFTAITQSLIKIRDRIAEPAMPGGANATTMARWLALNHRRFIADSDFFAYPKLKEPEDVLTQDMTELEAMSAIKRYFITLLTPVLQD